MSSAKTTGDRSMSLIAAAGRGLCGWARMRPHHSGLRRHLFFNTLGTSWSIRRAGWPSGLGKPAICCNSPATAEVILDSPEIKDFQGAERLWRFRAAPDPLPVRCSAASLGLCTEGRSPNSLMTGTWAEVERRQKAAMLARQWRPFRVAKIVDESAVIRSFHLEPTDGGGIIPHVAGQFLPIRVVPAGSARHYFGPTPSRWHPRTGSIASA